MHYSTGRPPDVDDMKEIVTFMKGPEDKGHLLRNLIKATVRSKVFLGRT